MCKNFFLAATLLSFSLAASAQTIVPFTLNCGGGSYNNSSSYYRYEWSIGEAASIQTFTTSSLIVTTGILQPGTHNPADPQSGGQWGSDEIKIFPVPVTTSLEVNILSKQKGKLNMVLYDFKGSQLFAKQIDYNGIGLIEKIDFSRFSLATYSLRITLEPAAGSVAKKGSFSVVKLNY